MPTVEETLRATGLTDEEISKIDAKALTGITQIVTSAQQALDKAELTKRAMAQNYDEKIAPALDAWANEKATLEANTSYYKTLVDKAKEGGFLPGDSPIKPPVGEFVANKNEVPGSPKMIENLRTEAGAAIGSMLDLTWEYQSLYGRPMPDSPTTLIKEANAQRLDPITYAAKKYDFAAKKMAMAEEAKKAERDAIVKETEERVTREVTEKYGSNPHMRQAEASKFSTLDKAVKEGTRPDPLKMTREQRHAATSQAIRSDMASNAVN